VTTPSPHIPLVLPGRYGGTRHVGYADGYGRLWTVNGNESMPTRVSENQRGLHPNKAHLERQAAFELMVSIIESEDEQDR